MKYKLSKLRQKLLIKLAWKMPRKLAYWAAIRVISNATIGQYENQVVPDLTAMDALERWDKD